MLSSLQTTGKVPDAMNMTGMLSKMSDQQLSQYASLHKEDPYTFSLAFAESNRRKTMRTPDGQQGQQPKVVDEAIDSMNPSHEASTELPENSGIATLPAPNIQKMAGGGIVAFADGGVSESDKNMYRRYALQEGQKRGLPPEFVDAVFTQESQYNPNALNKKSGAFGIAQINPKNTAKDYNITAKSSPYENMDAGLSELAKHYKKYQGNPALAAAAYNWGTGNVDAMIKTGYGVGKKPIPSETKEYMNFIASKVSKPEAPAVKKEYSNPAFDDPRAKASPFSPEYANWARENEDIGGLEMELQRRKNSKEAGVPADDFVQSIIKHGVGSSDQPTYLPPSQQLGSTPATPTAVSPEYQDIQRLLQQYPAPQKQVPQEQKVAPQEATPQYQSMSSDDWMRLGLGLLGSKSPHWQNALGEAGQNVLAGRQQTAANVLEQQKAKSQNEYYKQHARNLASQADYLASGAKDESAIRKQVAISLKPQFEAIDKGIAGFQMNEAQKAAEKDKLYQAELNRQMRTMYEASVANPPPAMGQYGTQPTE
jgi:hypothetical protein